MRVLLGCERSGAVRRAFRALGHDAYSCDIEPAEDGSEFHFREDAIYIAERGAIGGYPWDILIAFPPCTDIAVSGARWFPAKRADGRQQRALEFVRALMAAPIAKIAIENPVSVISSQIRKPDQIIQPYHFGHGEVKTTCLWLKGLPKLVPTNLVPGRVQACWRMGPSPTRGVDRARTYSGIAEAMASQWGRP